MADNDTSTIAGIVDFWREAGEDKWFVKDETFDEICRQRFLDDHFAAARREYEHWLETPEGTLALMILLDQFPRNFFRGTGHMYATDSLARLYASRALEKGHDLSFEPQLRAFFYMPFMHSEDVDDQRRSVELCREGAPANLEYADDHYDIVRRFGRFPHRNTILGRSTTEEEQAFLDAGGFAG
ncbi:DUF924 family protein [Phyllobacterium zundukense]|uniref:SpoVR like family protein n=1 Tax=Phyllobacterium zundukense TaxID=1867719 RepID=A0A2N9VQ62_9HYPH|nr:DUF924 family protein [Phyllobacterium zundukense]ATU90762.1 hypothetical protein BLM14_03210 [Phyllobacterium zundukense]PIO41630.1 hypothetical protein B5P45_27110 [Phyllobacterium zundukense]